MPALNPAVSKRLLQLERQKLGLCIQWITGFCNLMRHRHKKYPRINDNCRLCQGEIETPEHLSFYCPRLRQARIDCFLTHHGPPDSWVPKQIIQFITKTECSNLLTDETNYKNFPPDNNESGSAHENDHDIDEPSQNLANVESS